MLLPDGIWCAKFCEFKLFFYVRIGPRFSRIEQLLLVTEYSGVTKTH